MNSRIFFREHGQVIRTRSVLRELLIVAVACISTVVLLAWGHRVDTAESDRNSFEAGLVVGRQEMAETVGDAYRRGHQDALAQVCPAPAQQRSPL